MAWRDTLRSALFGNPITPGKTPSPTFMDQGFAELASEIASIDAMVAAGALGENWKATKAALDGDLAHAASVVGVVYNDATAANNGVYVKSGGSGSGSWSQITNFLPGYQFVTATDSGAGTPNAIVAVASPKVFYADGRQLIRLNVFETNTGSPVTVAFDGGAALTIKRQRGGDFLAGELPNALVGYVSGSTFQSIFDLPNEATLAAIDAIATSFGDLDAARTEWEQAVTDAEAAQAAAEAAQTAAETAQGLAETASANSQVAALTTATWTALVALSGSADGEGAAVLPSDTGTHSAASGTGYDGATVNNSGRYSWSAAWSRWVRIGDFTDQLVKVYLDEFYAVKSTDPIADGTFTSAGTASNGGVLVSSGGKTVGITVPAGSTGRNSYFWLYQYYTEEEIAALTGWTLKFYVRATITSGMLTPHPLSTTNPVRVRLRAVGGSGSSRGTYVERIDVSATEIIYVVSYEVQGDEDRIGPQIIISSTSTTDGSDYTLTATECRSEHYEAPAGAIDTTAGRSIDERMKGTVQRALYLMNEATTEIVVDSLGGGDYTTMQAALDFAEANATALKPYEIHFNENFNYTNGSADRLLPNANNVFFVSGTEGWIHLDLTAGPSSTYSAIDLKYSAIVRGGKYTTEAGRYGCHSDGSNNALFRDTTIAVYDAEFGHYGGTTGWTSQHGWGGGASSGETFIFERSIAWGPDAGMGWHTASLQDKPTVVYLTESRIYTTSQDGVALLLRPLGSGQKDQVFINRCSFGGDILLDTSTWNSAIGYPADRMEFEIKGAGNNHCVFRVNDAARALRVTSSTTGGSSSVALTGDGADLLFGTPFGRAGALGGYAYQEGDINVASRLGTLLGDCTGTPITMDVTVDGGAAQTVTFDEDHTAQSDTTIVAVIQAQITGATVSLETPGHRFYPTFFDQESTLLLDASGTMIPRRSAVAMDNNHRKVRLMTSADAAELFMGFALEDIWPGETGRVKTAGHLHESQYLLASGTVAAGSKFAINAAAPGQLEVSGGGTLPLRGLRPASGTGSISGHGAALAIV